MKKNPVIATVKKDKIKKDMKAITAQMGYRSISGPKWRPPNGQRSGGPRPTQHTPISDLIWTGPGHSFLKYFTICIWPGPRRTLLNFCPQLYM